MDSKGFSVSFIQSTYQHFGSGVILPQTGILWHNRGISFSLKSDHLRSLVPGKKPFHTLNPAAARLNDGRVMIYGTRGGDGQPQTQAAIFHRYVFQGMNLQKSISEPRWVYGPTTGRYYSDYLQLESRFSNETIEYLKERGHKVVVLPPFSEEVGHAGALVRYPNGMLEGAYDPRSNGNAAGF
ncbi:jg16208 [Pararge aegeria aegeria]|uniref:Jg16208 protein n=2 Tax=Pararge aegeria TaxID=116150 RepID=A0A8S4S1Q7_9NEOP|nr:jg16208 [Pararge aegeria aegeria]